MESPATVARDATNDGAQEREQFGGKFDVFPAATGAAIQEAYGLPADRRLLGIGLNDCEAAQFGRRTIIEREAGEAFLKSLPKAREIAVPARITSEKPDMKPDNAAGQDSIELNRK